MLDNTRRIGRFTSSEIWRLTTMGSRPMTDEELSCWKKENPKSQKKTIEDGFGAQGLSYIEEKKFERLAKRTLSNRAYSRDMSHGKVMEYFVNLWYLGMGWEMCSLETIENKTMAFHAGSPDAKKTDTVGEIKCYGLKNYMSFSLALIRAKESSNLTEIKKDFASEYWQVVSNSILLDVPKAALMVFIPKRSQMEMIRQVLHEGDFYSSILDEPQNNWWKYRFLEDDDIENLTWIPDESTHPNFVMFEFEVPKEDKDFLISRILLAEEKVKE